MVLSLYITRSRIRSLVYFSAIALLLGAGVFGAGSFALSLVVAEDRVDCDARNDRNCERGFGDRGCGINSDLSCTSGAQSNGVALNGVKRRIVPGETVETEGGKKLKVWSTEGPVSVGPAPEPFHNRRHELNPDRVEIYR
jgi:hypothetical protein